MSAPNEAAATPRRPDFSNPLYLYAGLLTLVIGVAYFNGFANLLKRWGEQEELSHGYFLPVIAGWLIWTRRDALLASVARPSVLGLAGVGVAAALLILSELTVTSLMIFQQFAIVILVAAIALALAGKGVLRLVAVPTAFLLFMVPPPYWLITVLSWKFQFWSSWLGVAMVKAFGIPVYLSGNVIDLGDYQLQVAEACSGLRYLFPFLSLGFLAAYFFKAPLWQRAIVFLSTIPITIVMNSFRIAVTSILVQQFGSEHAEGFLHLFEGWVVFLLCLVALFGVIAAIAALTGRRDFGALLFAPAISPISPAKPFEAALARRHAVIVVGVLAAAGLFVHTTPNDALLVPSREPLVGLPSRLPGWKAELRDLFEDSGVVSETDDYVLADLRSETGGAVNLYIAYLNMQRDGHSWHSPRQCIPGGGWKIESHTIEKTETREGAPHPFNRLVIEYRGHRQLVYYWYDQRGRKMANEFFMKSMLLVDAVRLRRTDGAMIRVVTPITAGQTIEQADARILAFMSELEPHLPDFVPPAKAAPAP